jgi:RimJ/RimL family protein N-acetyltransferase
VNPAFVLRTSRAVMRPVGPADLAELQALKADPRVFAMMLGGVRSRVRAAEELAEDLAFWAARGVGIWSVRDAATDPLSGAFLGIAGLLPRSDGLGLALRFAFWPEMRGRGLAREAAAAALRFAHERVGIARVVAVAREDNFASRAVLGAIGMRPCGAFTRDGYRLLIYASERRANLDAQSSAPSPKLPFARGIET